MKLNNGENRILRKIYIPIMPKILKIAVTKIIALKSTKPNLNRIEVKNIIKGEF